jgi:hypothetical protein
LVGSRLKIRGFRTFAAWLAIAGIVAGAPMRAAAGSRALVRAPGTQRVAGVIWGAAPPSLETTKDAHGRLRHWAVMTLQYRRPAGWTLIYRVQDQLQPVVLGGSGNYRLKVPLKWRDTRVTLTSVSPSGRVEAETSEVSDPWLRPRPGTTISRSWNLGAGLGYSWINYQDSRIPTLVEGAITLKASASYWLSPSSRWSLGVSGYYTLLPIQASSDTTIRYLGLNGRIGYRLPLGSGAWSLSLHTGVYYTTTFVADDAFGFNNMMGPQFFPMVSRAFASGFTLSMYAKVSPVSAGGFALSIDNREYATGLSASWRLKSGHSVGVTLDAASFKLHIEDVDISSSSLSLGVGATY